MSSEILREAAALMRSRAKAASTWPSGPWFANDGAVYGGTAAPHQVVSPVTTYDGDATHIASWHPAVALAVADWLDTAGADLWAHGPLHCADGCMECDDDLWMPHVRRALSLARTYLGADR